MDSFREFVTQWPWSAFFAIVFVLGGAAVLAILHEKGMPKLVGLIMGEEYRAAVRERERQAEAHKAAWEKEAAQRRKLEAARDREDMERAREISRMFREKVMPDIIEHPPEPSRPPATPPMRVTPITAQDGVSPKPANAKKPAPPPPKKKWNVPTSNNE